jgi:NAD+ dependent glucose-6-phosphate dehydrogenase
MRTTMDKATKRVLITGAAGCIGRVLMDRLGGRFELSSLDRRFVEGVPSATSDIRDLDEIAPTFEGWDAVVHLAADPRPDASWESVLANNIIGTRNVFEAARRAGVERVIHASSNHVMGGYYLEPPWRHVIAGEYDRVAPSYPLISEDMPIRPDGFYGIGKAHSEALGSYYRDKYGLSSVHLRIGWVLRDDDPTRSPFARSLWLSHGDLARLVRLCLDAPASLGYGVINATSGNGWKIFSLDCARDLLGFEPADNAERRVRDKAERGTLMPGGKRT